MTLISRLHFGALALLVAVCSSAFAATVTGTVTNKTVNKPAGGDDVVLIAFAQGMQEAGRTKTDAKGHYSIDVPDNGMHLIRVDHQKATYFQPVRPGTTTVNVDIYDVLPKVEGVSTEADVMRIETDQQGLHVIENYFVKNDSNPPMTQFSKTAYEIYLPPDARIEGSAAMGPGGMPVSSSPVPAGEKGYYAFIFPVRPGETRFQVSYHLPYNGSFNFTPKVSLPTQNVAIMLPKAMKFAGSGSVAFQPINDDVNAQTFLARNVSPSQAIAFTVSGSGSMPRESQAQGGENDAAAAGAAGPEAGQPSAAATDTRPGIGLGAPIDTPDPLNKYKWWILSGLALVLAVAAAFLLRAKPVAPASAAAPVAVESLPVAAPASAGHGDLLAALKEELFALETERLEGKLSESEYAELKTALETVLRRALSRQTVLS
ncbi:carboxypeptidase regulatory-like domain-containing protein [Alloacidobacterium dinghuense]|uniref:Carboxypeptidase regulatory-like domain-containing protein n=1 Tax=Alloacidobacterium dinghuense TaxID=2763107 RepID=A0A7G8BKG4_9BACT|nr:carboxypeptidase-like regulatory domain-containing protein [Alloacidobacterium dinghuense]QNI33034.1 carboxypeptidase regulatory-like domain-containing protein [Alloacidobacterium dinghuense]